MGLLFLPQAGWGPPSLRTHLLLLAGLLEPAAQGGKPLEPGSSGMLPGHGKEPGGSPAGSGVAVPRLGATPAHPMMAISPFQGNMSRGNSLFFRKVPAGKRYVWEERRFR